MTSLTSFSPFRTSSRRTQPGRSCLLAASPTTLQINHWGNTLRFTETSRRLSSSQIGARGNLEAMDLWVNMSRLCVNKNISQQRTYFKSTHWVRILRTKTLNRPDLHSILYSTGHLPRRILGRKTFYFALHLTELRSQARFCRPILTAIYQLN